MAVDPAAVDPAAVDPAALDRVDEVVQEPSALPHPPSGPKRNRPLCHRTEVTEPRRTLLQVSLNNSVIRGVQKPHVTLIYTRHVDC